MTDFQQFGLSDNVLSAVDKMGFKVPTEIQEKAIPLLVADSVDCIGLAHTGTGKTAAFAMPLLEKVDTSIPFIQALIVAPTRELAKQIENQVNELGQFMRKFKVVCVYGGVSIKTQIQDLKRPPHILIATPGRLIDLANRKVVHLKDVRTIVLDEADEMFKMGFKEEVDQILSKIDKPYNTWLFSATFPKEVRSITEKYMNSPVEFAVDSVKETNTSIHHEYLISKGRIKYDLLKRIIDSDSEMRGIVFCRTRRGTQKLADDLQNDHYKVDALHGDMSQAQRERVMERFRAKNIRMLIATDVAARGLDVDKLSHIIHYEIPDDITYYTHRSGRTGRAGETGKSILFIPPSKEYVVRNFQKRLKIKFQKAVIPSDRELVMIRMKKWANELLNTKRVKEIDPEIFAEAFNLLGHLSNEELIEQMTVHWLKGSNFKFRTVKKEEKRQKHKEAYLKTTEKKKNHGKTKFDDSDSLINFFVNVGYMDGFGKKDLLQFIENQSGIERDFIQNLEIFKKHAFFDAPKIIEGKIINRFRGLKLGNRKIRLNRNQN